VGRRPIERGFWPGHNSHARRWGTATTATANCGLRRCTETDLSIVRPTFSGDVADPYVRLGLAIFCCRGNVDQRRSKIAARQLVRENPHLEWGDETLHANGARPDRLRWRRFLSGLG
jgi:hypothetical protein